MIVEILNGNIIMKIDKRTIKSNLKLEHKQYEVFRSPLYVYKKLIDNYPEYFSGKILDPSAGDGRMIKYIIENKSNINKHKIIDIRVEEYDNWNNNGILNILGKNNCIIGDFLLEEIQEKYNSIITNPPFSLACHFVEKGLLYSDRVIILQKSSWIGTQKRTIWFNNLKKLKHILVIPNRPKWELDGMDNINFDNSEYFWYIFENDYNGPVVLDWLI